MVIEKVGNVPTPVDLEITYSDDTKEKIYHKTSVWKSGVKEIQTSVKTKKEVKRVELLDDRSPDGKLKNNVWEKK
jgi:hypothetical protein